MVCVLGAHTTVHYTRQAHKTHTNDLGKRLNKIIFSMMLNQRKITQHEVPIMGECTRFPWMSMWVDMWLPRMVYERTIDEA